MSLDLVALESGAAWIDRCARGRLRLDGADAVSFLQALLTNDVAAMAPGSAIDAAWLTAQGRMIADMRVCCAHDHLMLSVPPGIAPALAARLDAAIFSEDVRVTDVSTMLAELAVAGGRADAARDALGDAEVYAGDEFGWPGLNVYCAADRFAAIAGALDRARVTALAGEDVESLRIETARPAFGVDMTEETIPLEAGLEARAISQTKGCYPGQEVIIRVLHRGGGRVARRLVKLTGGADAAPAPHAVIMDGEREVGRITSVAPGLRDAAIVALGYGHRDSAEPGRVVTARSAAGDWIATIERVA